MLRKTFDLFGKVWNKLVPNFLAILLVYFVVTSVVQSLIGFKPVTSTTSVSWAEMLLKLPFFMVLSFVSNIFLGGLFASLFLSTTRDGQTPSLSKCIQAAAGRYRALLVAGVLVGLFSLAVGLVVATLIFIIMLFSSMLLEPTGAFFTLCFVLLAVLLIPVMVYFGIRLGYVIYLVMDGLSGMAAIRRSWKITRGRVWLIISWYFPVIGIFALIVGVIAVAIYVSLFVSFLILLPLGLAGALVFVGLSLISQLFKANTYLELENLSASESRKKKDEQTIPGRS